MATRAKCITQYVFMYFIYSNSLRVLKNAIEIMSRDMIDYLGDVFDLRHRKLKSD